MFSVWFLCFVLLILSAVCIIHKKRQCQNDSCIIYTIILSIGIDVDIPLIYQATRIALLYHSGALLYCIIVT